MEGFMSPCQKPRPVALAVRPIAFPALLIPLPAALPALNDLNRPLVAPRLELPRFACVGRFLAAEPDAEPPILDNPLIFPLYFFASDSDILTTPAFRRPLPKYAS